MKQTILILASLLIFSCSNYTTETRTVCIVIDDVHPRKKWAWYDFYEVSDPTRMFYKKDSLGKFWPGDTACLNYEFKVKVKKP